jgi:uncharacterized protein YodC (DUF2158 family)
MTDFQIGDIARLKSGGPKMTVNLAGPQNTFHCSWFRKKRYCTASFSAEALKRVKRIKQAKGELANGVTKERGLEPRPSPLSA